MIYGIKKREYKKEIQQKERQNILKNQNMLKGVCIKLNDNLDKKLDKFLEMSKVNNQQLMDFSHILENILAHMKNKITIEELHDITQRYDKKTLVLIHDILDQVVRNTRKTKAVKRILKIIIVRKK